MAWRVVHARHAFDHAVKLGAEPYTGADKTLEVPAIKGIGGSLIYFVDKYGAMGSPYEREFDWLGAPDPKPEGVGFYYLDHLTHNVYRGNMDKWFDFYAKPVQLPPDPLLRHRGQAHRPALARAHLALRPHPHPHQRVRRRPQPDRGVPRELQGRGHPAHRGRQRAPLRRRRRARRQRRRLHARPARHLLRAELRARARPHRADRRACSATAS